MKKILIVGMGMLGSAVRAAEWASRFAVTAASRSAAGAQALDIASDASADLFFRNNGPFDAVVNCAAEANVDLCEKEPERARSANALGVARLARHCLRTNAALVHVSTDYVFAGTGSRPLAEDDPTGPRSLYGISKLEGEFYALSIPRVSAVVRTTWIFGGSRMDFVNGMIDRFSRGETPGVDASQTASPTYAKDLADAIGAVLEKFALPARGGDARANRVFHCVNRGEGTRHAMALRIARRMGRPADLAKLAAQDIPGWVAVRPRYTVMATDRLRRECGVAMRPWEEALDAYLDLKLKGAEVGR